jgi:hypothetical protein
MSANCSGFLGAPALLVFPSRASPRQGLEGSLGPERRPEIHQDVYFIIARVPGRVRGARRGYDHLAHAMHALDASHPQAKPAGEDLETLLLAHVDVVGARGPSRLADPINLELFAARLLGVLPEYGPESRHCVY